MNENLINHPYVNNYNEDDIFNFLNYDPVLDILKHIHLKSRFRRILIKHLLFFYEKHILLFFIEILIGAIILIFPIILSEITKLDYLNLYLKSIVIFFVFYLLKFVYKLYDNYKYKYHYIFYWERSNFQSNINSLIKLALIFILVEYIKTIFNYIKNNNIEEENNFDLINKLLILLLKNNKNEDEDYYFQNEKENYFNYDYYLKTKKTFIFLLIFFSLKFLKSFIFKIKYQTEKIMIYLSLLIITLIYIVFFNKLKKEKNHKIFSIIQFILLSFSLLFYIIWIFRNMYKRIIKKKEKYFCIRKLSFSFILFATLNDILLIFGSILFFIYTLLILLKKNDKINIKLFNIKIIVIIILSGNCFYFGRYVLKDIYKPLCIQYIPARLKNKFYIKINKKRKWKLNK